MSTGDSLTSERHRGKHPEDENLFACEQHPRLVQAAGDLSWLFERDYPPEATLKLVGDRYSLKARQRLAVGRAVACPSKVRARMARRATAQQLAGQAIEIDGFNILLTIEAMLSGGVLLLCQDGVLRDMASIHGTYRTVLETDVAIDWLADFLFLKLQVGHVRWLLDAPVSNSGKLAQRLRTRLAIFGEKAEVELVRDPDAILCESSKIVFTSDSVILDRCDHWYNIVYEMWRSRCSANPQWQSAWLIDFAAQV